jgi:hypothetical protein
VQLAADHPERLDAGHAVLGDQPQETARLVLERLARLPADG